MYTQSFLVCDSSTLTNWKGWAKAISDFFAACGWVQHSDTGQVNWSTVTLPSSNTWTNFEIWKPGDTGSRTAFYVRIEYGHLSNSPTVRIAIGTGTNGSGTLTGLVTTQHMTAWGAFTVPSTTTTYECNMSGDANGRIGIMMFRDSPSANNSQWLFAIERSLDATGSYVSSHVSLWTAGLGANAGRASFQSTVLFGVGVAPSAVNTMNWGGYWNIRVPSFGATAAFNGSIPVDLACPIIGYHDNPCTIVGACYGADMTEGVPFAVSVYGATMNYTFSKNGYFANVQPFSNVGQGSLGGVIMRID